MDSPNSEFNQPEFPEFDSTPYGGGYDLISTYGKPRSPSDSTCYPRSSTSTIELPGLPNGKEIADHSAIPRNGFTPYVEPYDEPEKPVDPYQPAYEYNPWYDYGYTGQDTQYAPPPPPPCEYNGPCPSIFGYWPCLTQNDQKKCGQQDSGGQGYGNEWKGTAEYIFGSSNSYGEGRNAGFPSENFNYGYERHYVEQPTYVQEEYNESFWVQNPSYYESYQEVYPKTN
ncbi:hypothetical protein GIB67_006732 [Kingdonia uniflora]|uniref:Uncharacterized protein n=1 Tax=Kingdonia uniflora TaxID=39325 RepID=A0A7J7LYS4_9MAGN|nr:hypothetical protein GIB67_006732 [Kingdonia uniflora]